MQKSCRSKLKLTRLDNFAKFANAEISEPLVVVLTVLYLQHRRQDFYIRYAGTGESRNIFKTSKFIK